MLDYLIQKNNLMPYFEQVDLDETDIIFVKELIFGELNEQMNDEVRFNLQK
jgi:hypothetical protein